MRAAIETWVVLQIVQQQQMLDSRSFYAKTIDFRIAAYRYMHCQRRSLMINLFRTFWEYRSPTYSPAATLNSSRKTEHKINMKKLLENQEGDITKLRNRRWKRLIITGSLRPIW